MEYLGYVAANNPPPNYYLRRPPPPQPPQRSNSTTAVPPTRKSRFQGGHRRTNSSESSQSRSSHETETPAFSGTVLPSPDDPRNPSDIAALQGGRPQDRHRQTGGVYSSLSSPAGNRNKELPPTPAPAPLVGELGLWRVIPSSPHTAPTTGGAAHSTASSTNPHLSASPPNHQLVLGTRPSPVQTATTPTEPTGPSTVVTPARKIRKHQKSRREDRIVEDDGREQHKRTQSQQQETDSEEEKEQEEERTQEQDQEQQQEGQGQQDDKEQLKVRDTKQAQDQHQRRAQDSDREPDLRKHQHHSQDISYGHEHEQLENWGHALESQKNKPQGNWHQQRRRQQQQQQQVSYASIVPVPTALFSKSITKPFTRNESISSSSGFAALSTKSMVSSEPPSSADGVGSSSQSLLSTAFNQAKPFVVRNGRTYLSDPSLPYPLPVDLAELHRQSLRSLLLFQLFGGPVCSPSFANKPPTRVLEVGCGSAFWSIMCNQFYTRQGHRGISFSGIDIAPIGLGAKGPDDAGHANQSGPGKEKDHMNWRFVQHDVRRMPWPFAAEEFDLIMIKDVSLAMRSDTYQLVFDECIRLLQPGGTLEVWDSDHAIRLLRPHLPSAPAALSTEEEDDYESAMSAGAYVLTPNTPLSAPLNSYIVEYNAWLVKALESRSLPFAQCALAGALFLQEAEALTNVSSRRLAVPLSEMRWEREGVGGVVTKDGKTYIDFKGVPKAKGQSREMDQGKKTITPAQTALRRTALLTVVQLIQSLEPLLREVSGKSQDEWDGWSGKMMNDLMKENGTFWGECLEVGAWWAQKR